ncbi:murein hydrolase activator NlpD [Vibrio sp. SCSIO 43132]|uniref:murein hydrolase activator NlpD n=1 Tax=Vibrio sp. SCSIO 43132 TaxID=2779363 RepID=UPI003977BA52
MSLKRKASLVQVILATTLVGCAAHNPAPVTSLGKSYDQVERGSYRGSYYEVEKGDTLYFIAYVTGKDVNQLIKYNRLSPPYTIHPGQKISLWRPAYSAPDFSGTGAGVATAATKTTASTAAVAATSTASTASSVPKTKSSEPKKKESASSKKESTKKLDQSRSKEYVENKSKQVVNKPAQTTKKNNTKISKWLWPTKGRIIKGFSTGDQGNKGIDIAGQRGQSIVSTAGGTVVYSGNALRGYGNLVIVKHNDNYLSAYAHNERLLVREGQSVKAGQKIATMGSSGTNSVRLHFEIRYQGKSVNPKRYLP